MKELTGTIHKEASEILASKYNASNEGNCK
jgi:hypothetical protein